VNSVHFLHLTLMHWCFLLFVSQSKNVAVLRSIRKTASNYFSHDVYTFFFNKVFFYRINAVRHFTSYIIKCEDALYCLAFVQPCNCCANSCENVSNISSTLHQFKSAQETIFKVWEKFWGSFGMICIFCAIPFIFLLLALYSTSLEYISRSCLFNSTLAFSIIFSFNFNSLYPEEWQFTRGLFLWEFFIQTHFKA
jgi:hypothetical protein